VAVAVMEIETATSEKAEGETPGQEDAEFVTWLQEKLQDAEAYTDSDIVASERQQALDFYLRRPMGDERQGRSQIVSGDVYKVVEGVSTAIADIYCSSADAVQFTPRGEDDMKKADQRTEAVNYTFWTTCKGYLPMLEAIKSGVHLKTGYLMWYWAPEKRLTRETYRNLTQDALAMLQNDNDNIRSVKILRENPGQPIQQDPENLQENMAEGGMEEPQMSEPTFDVQVDFIKDQGRIVVESIAPEHVKISPLAKSADVQKAPEVFVVTYKSEAECMVCGYTPEQIEGMDFSGGDWHDSINRDVDRSGSTEGQARIVTGFVQCDRDKDGIVELHKAVFSGSTLLSDEIIDEINIAGWTPNIQPHEYFGRCPADDAIQSQRLNSTLWRQGLDSLYHATNPQWRIDPSDTRVNIEDFYSPEIGRPLRAPPGSAETVALPYVGQHVFPMLEYSTSDTENLTGWTRYAQGTDAAGLNQTLGGIRMITNMSQQRIKMMARNFGEMCFSRCLRGISKLLSQHGDKALAIRMRGKFVQVDPREWSEEYDMVVNVGLGSVDKEQQAMHLQQVSAAQGVAVQGGGLGKLLTVDNLYNVQKKIAELAGIKDPNFAWTDPKNIPPAPQQPPPVDPTIQKTLQADQQKFQAQAGIDQQAKAAEFQQAQVAREHDAQLQMALAQLKEQAETDRVLQLKQLDIIAQSGMQQKNDDARDVAAQNGDVVSGMAQVAPAIAQAMQMMAEGMRAMQQVAALLAAPKQGRAVKNKDGSISVITEPVLN
jgi:hypothetical protein